jgi:acetolactate synthase small subunit
VESPFVERELALVKVVGEGDHRNEAMRIADIFRAKPVDRRMKSCTAMSSARMAFSPPRASMASGASFLRPAIM